MSDKVAIYCRISKEDMELEEGGISESIQNQKLLLTDYAIKEGWHIYHIYCDEDLKGFDRDRPGFKKMLNEAERGRFNIILCKHQSRFTRDMELVEKYINGCFPLWGIRFVSIVDNIDTEVKGNKKSRQINGLINEWYSEDLSENIRAVFRKKMQDGQYLGSFASYGYMKSPEDKHKIIVDKEAAEIVREIYALYLEGNGCSKIALMLTNRGIPTPTQYKRMQGYNYANPASGIYAEKYGVWSARTINRILTNEVYIGTLIQGREKKISYKSKKVIITPKSEWVVIPNNHEPVIEQKVFYAVKELMDRNRRTSKVKGQTPDMPNIFAGKIKCANCGATMQRSGISRDGSTFYYRCALSAKTKRKNCTPHCIRQDIVEQVVLERINRMINEYMANKRNKSEIIEEVLKQLDDLEVGTAKVRQEISALENKIKSINITLAKAYAEKLNGEISNKDYVAFKSLFDQEKRECEERKGIMLGKLKDCNKRFNSSIPLPALIEKRNQLSTLDYEVIYNFINTIEIAENTVDNEKQIIINWNF